MMGLRTFGAVLVAAVSCEASASTHSAKLQLLEAEIALLKGQLEEAQGTSHILEILGRLLFPVALAYGSVKAYPAVVARMERRYCSGTHEGGRDLRKQLLYRLDNWLSTNPYSKMVALLYLSILIVVVGAILLFAVSDTAPHDALWESLAGVGVEWSFASASARLDPRGFRGVATRLVASCVSLGGVFITALLLGIVSEAIMEKYEELRRGKSDVLESGHTVVLGWSDKLFGVLDQLCLANESLGGGVVVLLNEKPKFEQEDLLAAKRGGDARRGTQIICRQGSPLVGLDLDRVSAQRARSVVVLSDDALRPDQADARSLRVALAFVSDEAAPNGDRCVVLEMQDLDNEPLVQLVGGDHVETIVTHDLIGRLMIQSARHPGLAQVWAKLLGFDGAEFYVAHHDELDGSTFGDALMRFDEAVPIGVLARDGKETAVHINPDDDFPLDATTDIIVIAEDDDTYEVRATGIPPSPGSPSSSELRHYHGSLERRESRARDAAPECVLFVGWRRDMDDIVQVLDEFVAPGSRLHIFCELPVDQQSERLRDQRELRKRPPDLANLTVFHSQGLLCARRDLEMLPISELSSIVILADEDEALDATSKDSQALTTLLLLRDIQCGASVDEPSALDRVAPLSHTVQRSPSARNVDLAVESTADDRPALATSWSGAWDEVASPVARAAAWASPRGGWDRAVTFAETADGRDEDCSSADAWSPRSLPSPSASARAKSPETPLRKTASPTWSLLRAQQDKCQIISEILDSRTSKLIADAQICDYVLSNDLVSMALAMIAEDRTVNKILKVLMESHGSEFYIRRAPDVVDVRRKQSFFDVMHAARHRVGGAEIVIGYKRHGEEPILNPPRKHEQKRWTSTCSFIVLAED